MVPAMPRANGPGGGPEAPRTPGMTRRGHLPGEATWAPLAALVAWGMVAWQAGAILGLWR